MWFGGIVRSSRSTQEEEKVQARDCRSPRDQKVPAEHRPPHSKAPVFTTRTHPSPPSMHNDWDSKISVSGFVGSRGRTGYDYGNYRLYGSWITMAEFGYPRSARSGRSLPSSSVRRRVSLNPLPMKTASNLTKSIQEPLRDSCEARHDYATRYSARSTNTWAMGRRMIIPFLFIYFLLRFSATSSTCFACSPCLYPYILTPPFPRCDTPPQPARPPH